MSGLHVTLAAKTGSG